MFQFHFTKKKYSFLFIEGEELFFECACVALQEVWSIFRWIKHYTRFSQYLQSFRVCRGWAPWPLQDWLHISRPPGHYGHGLDPLWEQSDSSVAHLLCCKYQEVSWCFIKPVFIHLHICVQMNRSDLHVLSCQFTVGAKLCVAVPK